MTSVATRSAFDGPSIAAENPGASPEDAKRRDIQGLRCLAVLLVMLFHAGVTGLSGGYVGVDVFFVISGFLITGNIVRRRSDRDFSILEFYANRARRLLPAAFVTIVVTLIGTLGPQDSWCLGHESRRPQVHGNANAAMVMLGLPGFVLLAVSELGSEIELAIETNDVVTGCPDGGVLARLHDRRRTDVRDLPAAGRAVTLVWSSGSGCAWNRTAHDVPGPRRASTSGRGRR